MASPEFLSLLNVQAPNHSTVTPPETPIIQHQAVDGQAALQLQQPQYDEAEETEYQPYDLDARKYGWLILQSNQMYNAQPFRNSEVFIMRTEDDTWEAWRESWKEGAPQSISLKVIAKGVPFHVALKRATDYTKVLTRRR